MQQNCAAGLKCIGQWDSTFSTLQGVCVSDGTIGLGQPCTSSASTTFNYDDNCKKGTVCDDLFGNAPLVCRKICATSSDCQQDEKCGNFTFSTAANIFGWCTPTCTPFSSAAGNCPSGLDCADFVDALEQTEVNGGTDGYFLCKKTGHGALFDSCSSDADCGKSLWCGSIDSNGDAACLPDCSDTVPCPQPATDAALTSGVVIQCAPYANAPNHAGYCYGI
jgi:hypothetical protein